jgi:hypothetical protein
MAAQSVVLSRTAQKTPEEKGMKKRLASLVLMLSLAGLMVPAAMAQDREFIKRSKNGVKVGDSRITLFDGPGIVNYEHKHEWMPGPGGAAIVIGTGAGAGAATGYLVSRNKKKGAVIGAAVGAGAATGIWLYKNRWHKHKIF